MLSGMTAYVIISLIMGVACYVIARQKGRNAALWFVGGVVFSIFGLVFLVMTKDLKIQNIGPKKT